MAVEYVVFFGRKTAENILYFSAGDVSGGGPKQQLPSRTPKPIFAIVLLPLLCTLFSRRP